MALQPQQATPPAGGLNQARPAPQPPRQENLAARAASMEQSPEEMATPPEDFFTKTMRNLQTQREALDSQTTKLLESLDARKNRLFDPTLMKMAAGFLAPTKTGSFGESLGTAASAAADEAEKEFARNQAIEKLKYELAQSQYEQAQKQAVQGHLMNKMAPGFSLTSGAGPTTSMQTPTTAGAAPGQPAPAGAPAAGGAPAGTVTKTGAPMQVGRITDKDIMEAMLLDPSGKLAQQYREAAKFQREDVVAMGNRPYSLSRQEFLPQDPNAIVEVDFGPMFEKPMKVPYSTFEKWKSVHDSGDRAAELKFFYDQGWLKRPAGAQAGEPAPEQLTAEERKQKSELAQERGKAQIQQEKEQIGRIDTNFTQAREIIAAANGLTNLAINNPRAHDLMKDDGIAAAVMRASMKPPFNLPTDELRSYKLSKDDRDALQLAARDAAAINVAFRKSQRVPGEGTTTDKETDLYTSLGIMKEDSTRTVLAKAEFLALRGKYDQEVFRAWSKFSKDPNNSYRDFLGSKQFDDITSAYDTRLGELQRKHAIELGGKKTATQQSKPSTQESKPAAPATKPTQTSAPAAPGVPPKKGTKEYNSLPVGGLFEDTDGTIRRKPKE